MKLAAVVLVVLLAGCLHPVASPEAASSEPISTTAAQLFPDDRPVLASIRFHEEDHRLPFISPDVEVTDVALPRDVNLTYHGIAMSFDEFGRSVPAYIFRFADEVIVQDLSYNLPVGSVRKAHHEQHLDEYAFDATDGRFMGYTDLTARNRQFMPPGIQSPLANGVTFLMTLFSLKGDLAGQLPRDDFAPILNWTFAVSYQRESTLPRPVPGDCETWRQHVEVDPPQQAASALAIAPGGPPQIVCLQAGQTVPLWVATGSDDRGYYTLQRLSTDFTPPAMNGTRLPGVDYMRQPWQAVPPLLPIPGLGPAMIPPGNLKGDWSDRLRTRVEAASTEPTFIKFRLAAKDTFVPLAIMGWPPGAAFSVLGIPIGPPSGGFDSMSQLYFSDGYASHETTVYTRNGSLEAPETHVAEPGIDNSGGRGPGAEALKAVVPAGTLQVQFRDLLPPKATQVLLAGFPPAGDFDAMTWWMPIVPCTAAHEGLSVVIEARLGIVLGAVSGAFDGATGTCAKPGLALAPSSPMAVFQMVSHLGEDSSGT